MEQVRPAWNGLDVEDASELQNLEVLGRSVPLEDEADFFAPYCTSNGAPV